MIFSFGDCEADEALYELRVHGVPVPMQRKSFDVLLYLVKNPGRAILKEELLTHVWHGVHVTNNALAQAITNVRACFTEIGVADPIATLRGRGYRFAAPVERRAGARTLVGEPERLAAFLQGALSGIIGGVVVDAPEQVLRALELLPDVVLIRSRAIAIERTLGAWRGAIDGELRPARGLRQVDDLVTHLTARGPVVVLLEAIDRADLASILLFLHLVRAPRPNLVVVATADLGSLEGGGDISRSLRQIAWTGRDKLRDQAVS
jgi:DNA-binding winged helix-turn-helix (wHTH) protein